MIPKLYPNCHAIIAAPGPSLTDEVVEILRSVQDRFVIVGVGDAYKKIDFMDEHYACDGRWWKIHGDKVNELCPNTNKWSHDEEGTLYGAKQIVGAKNPGFSESPDRIHTGQNSGYQALNLVYLWGCTKIILVGYNMKRVGSKSHFFEGREPTLSRESPYQTFVKNFRTIQPHIKSIVVNCTPDSALDAFRKSTLEQEL